MERLESLSGKLNIPFPHYENPPSSPKEIINEWVRSAREENVREPDAYTLATCNKNGEITMRTMFPVHFDGEVMLFATHSCSQKGHDIRDTGIASAHIYWREIGRQLSVTGSVVLASDQVSQSTWDTRSAAYDPVSMASNQSEVLSDLSVLVKEVSKYDGKNKLPRPDRFVVYQLNIERCEFWSATKDRIHQRLVYKATDSGWNYERLQP
ncbi:pyridoxal 5'-phosphate synthase [Vibrio sp. Of7-15]|uniref:pyridoxal 5'-phosphate synthase n=1 Tax=Vibrio sp. Of7-15 TaxID=2724879 RepID=UPI001EF3945F|nr:pyridoxal 5'-phosphate synthase [Vibrio sp. Of7-15]MCG7500092.1 pyridoxal 5'-phosphate synthase [Vibrio sp. Of7-15]